MLKAYALDVIGKKWDLPVFKSIGGRKSKIQLI